jgi:uncharacterized protein (TIGR02453 family)
MESTVIRFLNDLKNNNNRDWFNENKKYYQEAKSDFDNFIEQLIPEIFKFDPRIGTLTAKNTTFRIYRDVRFSKDKTPYKTHFGAFMAPGGRKSEMAGYYIHISADESFIGGGSHNPSGPNLKKIRSEIYYNYKAYMDIVTAKAFKKTFGEVSGDRLSRPPVGFPKDFEGVEALKQKSYTVFQTSTVEEITTAGYEGHVITVFKAMHPFVEFLNRAIAD